jgi:hypothetical protein
MMRANYCFLINVDPNSSDKEIVREDGACDVYAITAGVRNTFAFHKPLKVNSFPYAGKRSIAVSP